MKLLSIAGFALMLAAVVGLWVSGSLFARSPFTVVSQLLAVLLMIWARIVFGWRSFRASADPTAGGLVTDGPYRYLRHPIYAAICLFIWSAVFSHLSPRSIFLGLIATLGAVVRLLCEEQLILASYPEYRDYSLATKRLLPGIW